jgi:signal transduction histidine kinase
MSKLCEMLRNCGVSPTHDEGFRQELARLSAKGLRVIGIVEMTVPVFMLLAQTPFLGWGVWRDPARLAMAAGILGLGLLTTLAARIGRWSRALAWTSGWVGGVILIAGSLGRFGKLPMGEAYVPAQVGAVLLAIVAMIPFGPLETLSLGAGIHGAYLLMGTGVDVVRHVFVSMLTLLAAGLSGVIFHERLATWRASQALRYAQSRALLSENAAELGKLAAALCHELNSPLGALTSAVDTLFLVSERQAGAGDQEQARLAKLAQALRGTVSESKQRLHEIVTRVLRLTELVGTEVQAANVNELLEEVTGVLEPAARERVELRLEPVPPLVCRPQQLSAVFSSLLRNAVQAADGQGLVVVSSRASDSAIEVRVEDNGPGLGPEELGRIFDPGFRVLGSRVATGDWSLFGSRQVIQDHRGDIGVESGPGKGTVVTVRLPR